MMAPIAIAEGRGFDKSRKRAKAVSYMILWFNYASLILATGSLIYIFRDAWIQNEKGPMIVKFDSLSTGEDYEYFYATRNTLLNARNVGSTLTAFAVSIPQVIGAKKLYTGTLTEISQNDGLQLANFHQRIQTTFLMLDFFAFQFKVNLSGIVVEIKNIFWERNVNVDICLYVLIILFRLACLFVVENFLKFLLEASFEAEFLLVRGGGKVEAATVVTVLKE